MASQTNDGLSQTRGQESEGGSRTVTASERAARMWTALLSALRLGTTSFRGKVVLIAGGSRGLGLVMARRLAREGARLALFAREEDELSRARDDLRRRGTEVLTVRCDVRDRNEVMAAVKVVESELGPVDVLINNAGAIQVGPMEVMTLEDYEDGIRTHFWGPLHTTLAVLPAMKRRGRGHVINISSIGGQVPLPHLLPYTASKFALTGLSEGMRAELMKDGIVVTTVNPGLMRTGSPYNCFFKGKNREEFAWFVIADSLPLLSMSAERAARIILAAARQGRSQITVGAPAKLAARFHGMFPGLTSDLMGLVNRLLPAANGIGTRRAKGRDSQSRLSSSFLTFLTQRAARANNELPAEGAIATTAPAPTGAPAAPTPSPRR